MDLWSIGVMTYFLLAGYLPFESSSNVTETSNITSGKYDFNDPSWDFVSLSGHFS